MIIIYAVDPLFNECEDVQVFVCILYTSSQKAILNRWHIPASYTGTPHNHNDIISSERNCGWLWLAIAS